MRTNLFNPRLHAIMLTAFCMILLNAVVFANGIDENKGNVYVTIKNNTENLITLFKIIEKQTDHSFAYDENDVNLSKKITHIKGKNLLNNLLQIISVQSGLHFTQKENTFLVSVSTNEKTELIKNNIPIKGIVKDAAGNPLSNANVAVKGSNLVVQTDIAGNFSIDVDENATLIITHIGFAQKEDIKWTNHITYYSGNPG